MMIVCIGGAVLDRKYRGKAALVMGTSNPADGFRSFGGVARNVAENLARLGNAVRFASVIGDDESGRALAAHLAAAGADTRFVQEAAGRATAEYVAILGPDNDLAIGIADMQTLELINPQTIAPALDDTGPGDWVFFDCNLSRETINWLADQQKRRGFRLAADTVSTPKAVRLAQALEAIDVLFTNVDEAGAALGRTVPDARAAAHALTAAGAKAVVVTRGAQGAVVAEGATVTDVAASPANVVDITGAGDALIAGALHGLMQGAVLSEAVATGSLLAALTIESGDSVRAELSTDFLSAAMRRMARK